MGRPRTINRLVGDIAVEHVRRVRIRQAANPEYLLTEEDAKALKTLAETQVTLQKRRPEEDEDEDGADEPGMSIEELEASTAAAAATPTAKALDDDDA